MLTPEYLGSCTDYLLALYDELEEQILQDMARRIVKTGELTETADWQYKQLQEMGALQDFIYERLAEISGKSDAEIRRLFAESAYQNVTTNAAPLISHGIAVEMDLSAPMRQILEANVLRTSGNIKNLTRTIGSTGSMTYYDISNQAFMQAMSGAFSPEYAIREAIRRLGGSGVTVMFPGRKDKLDVAIRRNVRTSVAQTAATITMMQSLQMGVQYYETTAHIGARPEHAVWQGRVFKIEGSDPDHENFYDATQYGTAGGLCGVNCRHQFFPFWPGISKPAYSKETLDHYNNATVTYNGEEIPYYVATQMQRAMERGIRDTKRKIVVADAAAEAATEESVRNAVGEVAQKQRNVLKKQRSNLTDFCEQTGLAKDSVRVNVEEFGRGAKPSVEKRLLRLASDGNTFVVKSEDLYYYSKKIKPIENFTDIVGHGDPYSMVFRDANGRESNVSAEEFAKILEKCGFYKGGNIRLIACKTGKEPAVVAHYLADKYGVLVMAPTETVNVDFDGNMLLADDEKNVTLGIETGEWVIIKPRWMK